MNMRNGGNYYFLPSCQQSIVSSLSSPNEVCVLMSKKLCLLQGPQHHSTVHGKSVQSLPLPPHLRRLAHTVYGQGASVKPNRPSREGGGVPSGSLNLKACSKLVTVRNSSIFASCSPIHTLRPEGYRGKYPQSLVNHGQFRIIQRSTFQLFSDMSIGIAYQFRMV